MKAKSTQSRERGQGENFPLRGQGAELPCGVWGNAPTVLRATSMPNALNKGAGSEASLPVTSRIRRCAPKLLFPTPMLCRAYWRDRIAGLSDIAHLFRKQGISPLRRRPKGFPIALWKPSVRTTLLDFSCGKEDAPAGAKSCAAKAVRIFAGRGCGRLFSYQELS